MSKSFRKLTTLQKSKMIGMSQDNNELYVHPKDSLDRINSGTINFEDVPALFPIGSEVHFEYRNQRVGGTVINGYRVETVFGPAWRIDISIISVNDQGKISYFTYHHVIYAPTGNKFVINQMTLKIMSPTLKSELMSRGKNYTDMIYAPAYRQYSGNMWIKSGWQFIPITGDGRIIVDALGAAKQDPDMTGCMNTRMSEIDRDDSESIIIPECDKWKTWPYLPAFSFRSKRWGLIAVAGASEIQFRPESFDTLVLDSDKKNIIKSLVSNVGSGFSDIIAGKSGGFIFLLHGPPGTGKTLTAEATAEIFNRPLYMISVGELGTDTTDLEMRLMNVLELVEHWNAVLLLDEADIFLEQRTDHDMVRNAMVGIFLRQLEYFNGVMFLTTNRVKNFDKAFHSRISLAFNYPEMSESVKAKIWKNLLVAAHIDNVDIQSLSILPLNGRQIKNSIRLAQALARDTGITVNTSLLKHMSSFAEQFTTDMKPIE